ncbi:MFS transporter [Schauerella aestuarii]|uniref:MFS transporter n=1 Tax=Schauerella aestuarii TaxID=2511204 RepID=UPI00136DFD4A|nr:MFS transporter [Achromobacter aestuarii]MYZ46062.1 MFS transporter [Achromobacter aestuarii]
MKARSLSAYAGLGAPLAMAALPVYVIAPKFYGDFPGVSLFTLGLVLLLARVVDTVQDPFIGRWVDRLQRKTYAWARLLVLGSVLLVAGMFAVFAPPVRTSPGVYVWIALAFIVVYTAHSLVNICYLAWGVRLTDAPDLRARVSAWREGAGLAGVVLASVAPIALAGRFGEANGYLIYCAVFALLLAAALIALLKAAPTPVIPAHSEPLPWRQAWAVPALRRLTLFYGINSLAVSIPATLFLFFVDDVVNASAQAGVFLAIYFLGGAAALPLWVKLSDRIGKRPAWLIAAILACCAFVWAVLIQPGQTIAFGVICLLSGLALGADLALPPAMLADAIPAERRSDTGLYLGMWTLVGKLALALAAGVALPALDLAGYRAGDGGGVRALAWIYAALPCALKLGAAWVLWRGNAPNRNQSTERESTS